jgi:hypothetical protein
MSKRLDKYWEKYSLANMKKKNRDKLDLVDGSEGVGKSLWTIQQMGKLEPSIFETPEKFVSRIAFTPEEFFELVRKTKNGVVVFDEAFRGFSSRSALSKINKKLVSALMEMRQNNNIVFIVLPSFFLLDVYPAMLRSNALFNIFIEKRSGKRGWRGYNKYDKNEIYQRGVKKGWIYTKKSFFSGNFYGKFPGGPAFEKAYLDKKEKSLMEMDLGDKKTSLKQQALEERLLGIIKGIYNETKSLRTTEEKLKSYGYNISYGTIRRMLMKGDPNGLDGLLDEKDGIPLQN